MRTFALSEGERQFLLSAGTGQGLLSTGTQRVALQAIASGAEHRLITTDPAELAALSESIADTDDGIDQLPSQDILLDN